MTRICVKFRKIKLLNHIAIQGGKPIKRKNRILTMFFLTKCMTHTYVHTYNYKYIYIISFNI